MPELIIYVIAIIVACAAVYYLAAGLPQPWNWAARGVAIVLILFWLGRILRIWAVPLVIIICHTCLCGVFIWRMAMMIWTAYG